jgi:hypothetical protein
MRRFHLLMGTGVIATTLSFGGVAAQTGGPADTQPLLMAQLMPGPEYPEVAPTERRKPARPPAASAQRELAPRAAIATTALRCLPPGEVPPDKDGDFARNMKLLQAEPGLCFSYDEFEENGIHWGLQIVQYQKPGNEVSLKTRERAGPLWFIPHDDENAAFDTAVKSLIKHGGTIVAVESGGTRLNEGQDPNRNFDAGGDRKCPLQLARSPQYTQHVLQWRDPKHPIIALHSNKPTGGISITRKVPFSTNFRAPEQIGGVNPDHTLVFVASSDSPEADPILHKFVKDMNAKHVNVIYETVSSKRSDCSLSNYASLRKIRDYLNVEVVTGDSAIQVKIVDVIMALLPIGPRVGSATTPAATEGPTGSVPSANTDDSEPRPAKKPRKTANKQKKPPAETNPQ